MQSRANRPVFMPEDVDEADSQDASRRAREQQNEILAEDDVVPQI